MSSSRFDPFNNRVARDIRNTLSKSFLQALAEKDREVYRRCAAGYLKQDLEPVYEKYITERLERYGKVFRGLEQKKSRDALQQAAALWDNGLYFEMHELLEEVWKKATGARRKALQGLIRAAGMKIHAENSNMKAAVSMGTKGLADLERYHDAIAGFPNYNTVVTAIRNTVALGYNRTGPVR